MSAPSPFDFLPLATPEELQKKFVSGGFKLAQAKRSILGGKPTIEIRLTSSRTGAHGSIFYSIHQGYLPIYIQDYASDGFLEGEHYSEAREIQALDGNSFFVPIIERNTSFSKKTKHVGTEEQLMVDPASIRINDPKINTEFGLKTSPEERIFDADLGRFQPVGATMPSDTLPGKD
jgi:hypothetical protein